MFGSTRSKKNHYIKCPLSEQCKAISKHSFECSPADRKHPRLPLCLGILVERVFLCSQETQLPKAALIREPLSWESTQTVAQTHSCDTSQFLKNIFNAPRQLERGTAVVSLHSHGFFPESRHVDRPEHSVIRLPQGRRYVAPTPRDNEEQTLRRFVTIVPTTLSWRR